MTFSDYRYLVFSDLYRMTGRMKLRSLLWQLLAGASYKYAFWLRTSRYTSERPILRGTLHPFTRLILRHYMFKFGIVIPYSTEIGAGLYIGHFSGIIVSEKARIGRNCSLSQGVTIGKVSRGDRFGYPTLGDNVYLGPGCKVIGNVKIGNNVAVGANCVVTRDVPDNAVVAGVPGKILSFKGSGGYIPRTDYDRFLGRAPSITSDS
jgi:serine O-acetyltransferase